MRSTTLAMLGLMVMGCQRAASPPVVMVPPVGHDGPPPIHDGEAQRALPHDEYATRLPPPPFDDAPIVSQPTPEQSAFVDTYNRVGHPRIEIAVEPDKQQRDDAWSRSFDDEAIRNVLADWFACNGQVTMVASDSPDDADVVIRIRAAPTRQYDDGLRIRLLAEAVNTKDRASIGRAFVDIPPPLEKPQINRYTRWLARKLMDDMTAAWLQPEPAAVRESSAPPSTAPSK